MRRAGSKKGVPVAPTQPLYGVRSGAPVRPIGVTPGLPGALGAVSAMKDGGKAKKPKLGTGERFAALRGKIAKDPNVTDPGAVAAAIGRKKYGSKKMAAMAAKGKK